ncbi:hypothetical protein FJT64_011357 [Amphibalanus amphitrite]|uniref:Neurotransmitter-gated ion-channel ligand-binding domain-containing protein n=1 Tax=Amphibalanus amphitrite TaxID=1232801 RepID=A0A6A4VMC9_AMPAM|nr:hypothetical protein FJT64_011357 [Amphibalanus amphitrite]
MPFSGEPVTVELSLHILDIVLDERAQTVKFDSYFRTFWKENRFIIENMTKPYVQMDTDAISKLWLPNLFALFVQKVEKPELIIPAAGVHLYQDKTIFRVRRWSRAGGGRKGAGENRRERHWPGLQFGSRRVGVVGGRQMGSWPILETLCRTALHGDRRRR